MFSAQIFCFHFKSKCNLRILQHGWSWHLNKLLLLNIHTRHLATQFKHKIALLTHNATAVTECDMKEVVCAFSGELLWWGTNPYCRKVSFMANHHLKANRLHVLDYSPEWLTQISCCWWVIRIYSSWKVCAFPSALLISHQRFNAGVDLYNNTLCQKEDFSEERPLVINECSCI